MYTWCGNYFTGSKIMHNCTSIAQLAYRCTVLSTPACLCVHNVCILQLYIFEKAEIPASDLAEFSLQLALYNISLSEYRESLTEEVSLK